MPDTADSAPPLALHPSRMFQAWLAGTGASLSFTTYQAGNVFFIGTEPDTGKLPPVDVALTALARGYTLSRAIGDRRVWPR